MKAPAFAFRAGKGWSLRLLWVGKGWSLRLRRFKQLDNRANSKRELQKPAKVQFRAQCDPHRETGTGRVDMALHNGLLCGEWKTGVTGSIPEFYQTKCRVNEETEMRRGSDLEADFPGHSNEIG